MLAAAAAHHFLGDDVADDTASPADNSMEQSENMHDERQRRFWVRVFLKVMNETIDLYRVNGITSPAHPNGAALSGACLVKKVKTGTVNMQKCL